MALDTTLKRTRPEDPAMASIGPFKLTSGFPTGSAPARGSATARADADAVTNPSNVLGIPTGRRGTLPPLVVDPTANNPVAPPTPFTARRAGEATREGLKGAANLSVEGVNALTYPMRAAAGKLRDFGGGLFGTARSPNEGDPIAGYRVPFPEGDSAAAAAATAPTARSGGAGGAPAAAAPPDLTPVVVDPAASTRLAPPTRDAAGVTVNGRHLDYGAMVNGVPTFSDGTGGIRRTVSDAQIADLGSRLQTAPTPTAPLASDVFGGTQTQDAMVARAAQRLQRPNTAQPDLSREFAASDQNAVLSRDWRSAAGTAAHNLALDAEYAGSPRLRRQATAALQAQAEAANKGVADAGAAANDLALQGVRGDQALALEDTRAANDLRNHLLTRNRSAITLQDGSVGLLDPVTGTVTPARGAGGQPVRLQRPQKPVDQAAYGKFVTDMTQRLLGANEFGQIADPSDPKKTRAPTPQEIALATQRAQILANQTFGGGGGGGANTGGEADVYVDAQGNKARLVNGKYVPVE